MELSINSIQFWLYIGGGALLLALFVTVLSMIVDSRSKRRFTPGAQAVIDAFMPYIYQAILAGERAVIWGFDVAEAKIDSTDKTKVAASVYALIPDTIVIGGIPIPSIIAKRMIPRDEFERLVALTYDQVNAFLIRNEDYLKSRVDALKIPQEAKPPDGSLSVRLDGQTPAGGSIPKPPNANGNTIVPNQSIPDSGGGQPKTDGVG